MKIPDAQIFGMRHAFSRPYLRRAMNLGMVSVNDGVYFVAGDATESSAYGRAGTPPQCPCFNNSSPHACIHALALRFYLGQAEDAQLANSMSDVDELEAHLQRLVDFGAVRLYNVLSHSWLRDCLPAGLSARHLAPLLRSDVHGVRETGKKILTLLSERQQMSPKLNRLP